MAEHTSLARPSLVDGMRLATARDIPRILWWQAKGYAFGARRGPATSRIVSATTLALLAIPPFLVVAAAAMLWQVVGPRRSDWHMTDNAVMAVAVTKKGWTLHSHGCARPGSGAGAALRDVVMPTWIAEADAHHVPIQIGATTERLAEVYAEGIPGLRVIGTEWPRGRAMRREPSRGPTTTRVFPQATDRDLLGRTDASVDLHPARSRAWRQGGSAQMAWVNVFAGRGDTGSAVLGRPPRSRRP